MNKIAIIAGKVSVTFGLLYFALRGVDISTAGAKLANLDPAWSIAAILACLGQLFFGAARWTEILMVCGDSIRFLVGFRLVLIGNFFSQTLPSTVGGDGVRLYLLRRCGVSWRAAAFSVFLDRAVGLVVLALMVAASMPWSFQLIADGKVQLVLAVTAIFPALGGAVFLSTGLISSRVADRWLVLRELQSLAKTALVLLLGRSLLYVAFASIVSQIFAAAIAWCAGQAVGVPTTFDQMFLLVLPVTLITAIPISIAGWGVREQALQFAFLAAGLSGSDGVLISLLFGATYLLVGLLGGLIWLATGRQPAWQDPNPTRPDTAGRPASGGEASVS